jgi:gamma-glutamyltranspeptidase/glutathione hydrolase
MSRPPTTMSASSGDPADAKLFLAHGKAPAVGSVFRNPDLAATVPTPGPEGTRRPSTRGPGRRPDRARRPATRRRRRAPHCRCPRGFMAPGRPPDLPRAPTPARDPRRLPRSRRPTAWARRPAVARTSGRRSTSSSATTCRRCRRLACCTCTSRASALAFADRAAFRGRTLAMVDVPLQPAAVRRLRRRALCQIDPQQAATRPVEPGEPDGDYSPCGQRPCGAPWSPTRGAVHHTCLGHRPLGQHRRLHPHHRADRRQRGSTVPGRGFLLNTS